LPGSGVPGSLRPSPARLSWFVQQNKKRWQKGVLWTGAGYWQVSAVSFVLACRGAGAGVRGAEEKLRVTSSCIAPATDSWGAVPSSWATRRVGEGWRGGLWPWDHVLAGKHLPVLSLGQPWAWTFFW